jgi:hypothetical protein
LITILPPIPTPPLTNRAPVLGDVEIVVLVIVSTPFVVILPALIFPVEVIPVDSRFPDTVNDPKLASKLNLLVVTLGN